MLSQVCLVALVVGLASASPVKLGNDVKDDGSAPAPIITVPMTCSDENTYGVYGCNETYYQCSHGEAFQKQCSGKLFFDIATIECRLRFQVQACNAGATGMPDFEINTDKLPDCEDGDEYVSNGDPCSRFYGHCSNGKVLRKFCPYDQVWLQVDQTCQNVERVDQCKVAKKSKISGGAKIQGSYNYNAPQQLPQAAPQVQPTYQQPQQPAQDVVIKPAAQQSAYNSPGYAPQSQQQSQGANLPQDTTGYNGAVGVAKSEFDCETKQDGIYLVDQNACVTGFYKCSNFRSFKYNCPMGTWYDYEENICNYKEFVPTCGGVRPAPTSPAPQRDVPKTNFDCSTKSDGSMHVESECPPNWISCLGGIATLQECPPGLVFDMRIARCDFPQVCKGPLPQPNPQMDFAHGGSQPSGPYSQPVQQVATVQFNCQGKPDGWYAMSKCVNQYVACNGGAATGQTCPSNLVFDDVLSQCNYKPDCMAPKQPQQPQQQIQQAQPMPQPQQQQSYYQQPAQAQPQPLAQPQPQYQQYQKPAPQAPPQPRPQPQPLPQQPASGYGQAPPPPIAQSQPLSSVNCANLPNGAYPVGKCNSNYVQCWNTVASPAVCPQSLMFNSFNGACDYSKNVPDCPDFQAPIQQDQASTVPPAPADTFCEKLADGSYANGCSSSYYVCHASRSHKMLCPVGLFYDLDTNACAYKDQVAACGGSVQPAQQQPTQSGPYAQQQPKPLPQSPPVQQPLPQPQPQQYNQPKPQPQPQIPQTSAQQQPYTQQQPLPQSPPVQQPLPQPLPQPQPQQYNQPKPQPQPQIQQAPAQPQPYTQQQPLPQSPPVQQPLPQPLPQPKPIQSSPYTQSQQQQPLPSQDTPATQLPSCAGKPDGIYGLPGCTSQFYQCYRGNAKLNKCLDTLFYNVINGMCDFKERVAACGGSLPTPTPATPIQPPQPAQDQSSFACQGKQDGYYSQGCSNWYWGCVAGVAIKHQCNGMNLFFSAQTLRCDQKQWVPECGGKIQQKPQPQPQQPQTLPAQSQPQAVQSCLGKQDGAYSMGACSGDYISCYQGQGMVSKCPVGLIFNELIGGCDYDVNVASCGKMQPAQDIAQPQPQQQQQPPPRPSSFDCSNKQDGFWATAQCSELYVLCQMGRAIQESPCPSGLAFSTSLQMCQYKTTMNECNSQAPQQQPMPQPQPQPQPQTFPAQDTTTNFCAQKMNGLYTNGCSSQYIMCTNFQTTPLNCPSTLVFDTAINRCNYPNLVSACQSPAQSPAQPQPLPQQQIVQPMPQQQQQPMTQQYNAY